MFAIAAYTRSTTVLIGGIAALARALRVLAIRGGPVVIHNIIVGKAYTADIVGMASR